EAARPGGRLHRLGDQRRLGQAVLRVGRHRAAPGEGPAAQAGPAHEGHLHVVPAGAQGRHAAALPGLLGPERRRGHLTAVPAHPGRQHDPAGRPADDRDRAPEVRAVVAVTAAPPRVVEQREGTRPLALPAAAPRRRRSRRRRLARGTVPYLYIAPTMGMFGLFVLAPFVQTARLSFFQWDGITAGRWIGLGNYRDLASDPVVHSAFEHAFVLILFFSIFPIAIALGLAATSQLARVRGDSFMRTLIFLPQIISTVVVGVTWNWIFAPDGPLNQLLGAVGLGVLQHNWLGSFTWTLPAVGVIGTWAVIGLCVALFVAGIQTIP